MSGRGLRPPRHAQDAAVEALDLARDHEVRLTTVEIGGPVGSGSLGTYAFAMFKINQPSPALYPYREEGQWQYGDTVDGQYLYVVGGAFSIPDFAASLPTGTTWECCGRAWNHDMTNPAERVSLWRRVA